MVVVHSDTQTTADPAFRRALAAVTATASRERRGRLGRPAEAGRDRLRDGHTAIVSAGSQRDADRDGGAPRTS